MAEPLFADREEEYAAKQAIIDELRSLKGAGDIELAHSRADELIINFIKKLGYDTMADAWDDVPKWYA